MSFAAATGTSCFLLNEDCNTIAVNLLCSCLGASPDILIINGKIGKLTAMV